MGHPVRKPFIEPEEYLRLERAALEKHQYYQGEIFCMAGGTSRHSLILVNTLASLHLSLRGKPCRVYESNLRIRVPATTLYTYPDLSIICGPIKYDPIDGQKETVLNPTVIVEILSPSTERYDRGLKFDSYRQIETLNEYVLISQARPMVERFVRGTEGAWEYTAVSGIDAVVRLSSVPAELKLSDVYDGVELTGETPPDANERASHQ